MRIALLTNEGGGITSVSNGLARGLSKLEIETTIFFATAKPRTDVERLSKYLKVVSLPLINFPPRSAWFFTRYFHIVSRLFSNYDLVHVINPELAIGSTFFTPQLRRSLITTLHGSNKAALKAFLKIPARRWTRSDFAFHVLELPLHDAVTKRCVARSNRTIVCSYTTLNELETCEKLDISKISVIYNGVDFSEIHNEEAVRDSRRKRKRR